LIDVANFYVVPPPLDFRLLAFLLMKEFCLLYESWFVSDHLMKIGNKRRTAATLAQV